MHHELKIKDCYYQAMIEKRKTCELRYNDRDYHEGDTISFIVVDARFPILTQCEGYVYKPQKWKITHVLEYQEGLKDGWVVLSLKKL